MLKCQHWQIYKALERHHDGEKWARRKNNIFLNAFVFTHKTFTFPQETLPSLTQLFCSLEANIKYLGESQNFCEQMPFWGSVAIKFY